jgi:SAM-dependent methyltransferase
MLIEQTRRRAAVQPRQGKRFRPIAEWDRALRSLGFRPQAVRPVRGSRFLPGWLGFRYGLLPRRWIEPLHAHGRLLDVGCGRMPLRAALAGRLEAYDGVDREPRSADARLIADAHDLSAIADASYDTVIALSVLEHLARPGLALAEMRRVARPGGVVVLEVPHLSRLHEEPDDFWRFTGHGLRELAGRAGLESVEVVPIGGLFAFLGHQWSTLFVCAAWSLPLLRWAAFGVNLALVVWPSLLLDRWLGTDRVLPLGYVGVFRAPPGEGRRAAASDRATRAPSVAAPDESGHPRVAAAQNKRLDPGSPRV